MIDLRLLQLSVESTDSVDETRQTLNNLVKFFRSQEIHQFAMEEIIVKERLQDSSVAEMSECFFIDEDFEYAELPDEFKPESLGLCRGRNIIYAGRLVYPVKDVDGNVMGLCGWDKFDKPKYLDSKNNGYKAKDTTLYGMENLREYYSSNRSVFLFEGIPCCNYARSKGHQALSSLGSNLTTYVVQILKRFGPRLIVVPDSDEAGHKFAMQVRRYLPEATVLNCRLDKDLDDSRKIDEQGVLEDLRNLDLCPWYPILNTFYHT